MPKFFEEWLKSLTPQQADEMWKYFDMDNTNDAVAIIYEIAMSDSTIAKREWDSWYASKEK